MNPRSLSVLACLLAATHAAAQSDPATVDRIVTIGAKKNGVMGTLKALTDIGPRLTSSNNLRRAQSWAMREFEKYGLRNVHLEKWGDVPVGFERGSRQVGRMVAPYDLPITFTTQCWMPGTDGRVEAEAVAAPKDLEAAKSTAAQFKGKWVVMKKLATMRGPSVDDDEMKKVLGAAGVAGFIFGEADDRVHSSGRWIGKTYENHPTVTEIIIARPDYDRIVRNIELERKPVLAFDIENRFLKGPLPQYNVVADLPGTEKPDEIVIVCGHLDSWNSPGSQGACDNGTGSSVAIEAARILSAAKAKPKRTIRFILWSGEEQGLLGSRGYVEMHKAEMDKISAVLNDDGGTGYQAGYEGLETMKPMMEAAFAPTVAAFPSLPMRFSVLQTMPQGGSSDHAPFNWEGVPGFYTFEGGKTDYGHVWHTQYDRYDQAVAEYLIQSSTNHAVVAYNLACAPTMVPRGPKPPPRTTLVLGSHEIAGADRDFHAHDHSDDYWLDKIDRMPRWVRIAIPSVLGR